MLKKFLLTIGISLIALAAVGTVASARESAAKPNLAKLVLRQADIPGSTIIRQGYVKDPDYVRTYEREFEGGRFQSLRLENTESDVSLAASVAEATMEISFMQNLMISPSGRRSFESMMREGMEAEGAPVGGKVLSARCIRARKMRLGDGGLELMIAMRVTGGELGTKTMSMQFSISEFRVDRVLATLLVMSKPGQKLPPGDITKLAGTFVERVTTGLNTGGGL